MAATTTPSIKTLTSKIAKDFSQFKFVCDSDFSWDPSTNTIFYDISDPQASNRLLHELAHGVLNHSVYERDIDLIAMERDAWNYAKTSLGLTYNVAISSDVIHNDMETYRDWMHARSTCPSCQSNGIETAKQNYTCVNCREVWRVNDARSCSLRRIQIKK